MSTVAVVKKFINAPDDVVPQALEGMALAHPGLIRVDMENQNVIRADAPVKGKVALISGGGSGHEPMHGGFVGRGMLDAACCGAVFTSPVPDQMAAAGAAVDGGAGIVHIVKNYTGDVLNFKMAAEMAEDEGVKVESVVMDDDVAVKDSLYTAGRRGTGATVLAEKLAGARAEDGGSLSEVADIVKRVNENARSFGVALTSCATPSSGTPIFELGDDEIELGVGIHGEPGRERAKWMPAAEIAARMVDAILEDLQPADGSQVLVFMNGLGGTPLIEQYLMYNEVRKLLDARNLEVTRTLVGSLITSLEMAGSSLTILKMDDELTRLWDAPVVTPGLRWGA
jgi:dihydroxyacetone kinase-like protein